MIIRQSKQLLEHLSEIEEEIRQIERLLEKFDVECDRDRLIKSLLAKRIDTSFGQND